MILAFSWLFLFLKGKIIVGMNLEQSTVCTFSAVAVCFDLLFFLSKKKRLNIRKSLAGTYSPIFPNIPCGTVCMTNNKSEMTACWCNGGGRFLTCGYQPAREPFAKPVTSSVTPRKEWPDGVQDSSSV